MQYPTMEFKQTSSSREACKEVLKDAVALAQEYGHRQVFPMHLAAAFFQPRSIQRNDGPSNFVPLFKPFIEGTNSDADVFVQAVSRNIKKLPRHTLPSHTPIFSPAFNRVLRVAEDLRDDENKDYITPSHLIRAVIKDETVVPLLAVANIFDAKPIVDAASNIKPPRQSPSQTREYSTEFTIDMVRRQFLEGGSDPVVGREDEVDRILLILMRNTKNSVVLVGERGVGKTAVVKVLANHIRDRTVPARFSSCRLISTEARSLNKNRLDLFLKDVKTTNKTTILFIDDVHHFLAGYKEATSHLEDILARENLHCILATTPTRYMQFINNNETLGSQLQRVLVKEPSMKETIYILNACKPRYENYHRVHISEDAVIESAILAARDLTSRSLPESAINLMDEAAATVARVDKSEPGLLRTLEFRRKQVEKEISGHGHNRDKESESRLATARSELVVLKDQIYVLVKQYEDTKQRRRGLIAAKLELEKMTEKVGYATWNNDWGTVTNIERHMIPNLKKQIAALERKSAEAGDSKGGIVGPDEIRDVVNQWIKDRDQLVDLCRQSSIGAQAIPQQPCDRVSGASDEQTLRSSDIRAPGASDEQFSNVQAPRASGEQTTESSDIQAPRASCDQIAESSDIQASGISDGQTEPFDIQAPRHMAAAPVSDSASLKLDLNEPKNVPKVRKRDKFRNSIGSISSLFHRGKNQHQQKDTGFPAKASDKNTQGVKNQKTHALPVVRSSTNMQQSQTPALSAVQSNNNNELQAQKQARIISQKISGCHDESNEAIRLLKANNFRVDRADFQKDKALIWAAENGHEAAARYLILDHPDSVDDFATMDALYGASKGGHPSIITLFLSLRFVDPKRKYCYFKTDPLHEVAKCGDEACMKSLLAAGADVKTMCNIGRTALHEATACRNLTAMRLLLQHNAPLDAVDSNGETALHLAARQGHEAAVKLLLGRGIGVMRQSMEGWSALHLAAQHGYDDVVKMLLETDNANVTAGDDRGRTALHLAVANGHRGVVRLLLEHGADPQAKDKSGQTSSVLAYERGLDVFRTVP
jgi:ankyrin repeat protein